MPAKVISKLLQLFDYFRELKEIVVASILIKVLSFFESPVLLI